MHPQKIFEYITMQFNPLNVTTKFWRITKKAVEKLKNPIILPFYLPYYTKIILIFVLYGTHDLTARICVLHKITTALKFMSYLNQN